tara:strand:- start:214 stop:420 length:207 start_codon:yes stop_codon:yes gene_type:complete
MYYGFTKINWEVVMNKPKKVFKLNTDQFMTAGATLAMIISWSVNKSILWAMLHGIFSWFYVIYYALVR